MTSHLSPARRRALAALHASRRGVRVNTAARDLDAVLASVRCLLDPPVYRVRSVRVLADHLGVTDRTVRRWLAGTDRPPPGMVGKMRRWIRLHRAT